MNREDRTIRTTRKIEALEGLYEPIPEDVFYRIPAAYRLESKQRLSPKKLLAAGISLCIFVGAAIYLIQRGFRIESVCTMFPLLLITLLIFVCSVSPNRQYVTRDSQILEAKVTNVEVEKRGRGIVVYIATLYVPSVKKEVTVNFGQAVIEGRHVVIVNNPKGVDLIQMPDDYVPRNRSDANSACAKKG